MVPVGLQDRAAALGHLGLVGLVELLVHLAKTVRVVPREVLVLVVTGFIGAGRGLHLQLIT